MKRDAIISEDGVYRYRLTRDWEEREGRAVFVMLNPSTADSLVDDPTIRRCIGFAKSWGYGALTVVNLFAYRATSPLVLAVAADPIGPENDEHLRQVRDDPQTDVMVAAWGVGGSWNGRDKRVKALLQENGKPLHHLSLTKQGHPRHPLYLPAAQGLERW